MNVVARRIFSLARIDIMPIFGCIKTGFVLFLLLLCEANGMDVYIFPEGEGATDRMRDAIELIKWAEYGGHPILLTGQDVFFSSVDGELVGETPQRGAYWGVTTEGLDYISYMRTGPQVRSVIPRYVSSGASMVIEDSYLPESPSAVGYLVSIAGGGTGRDYATLDVDYYQIFYVYATSIAQGGPETLIGRVGIRHNAQVGLIDVGNPVGIGAFNDPLMVHDMGGVGAAGDFDLGDPDSVIQVLTLRSWPDSAREDRFSWFYSALQAEHYPPMRPGAQAVNFEIAVTGDDGAVVEDGILETGRQYVVEVTSTFTDYFFRFPVSLGQGNVIDLYFDDGVNQGLTYQGSTNSAGKMRFSIVGQRVGADKMTVSYRDDTRRYMVEEMRVRSFGMDLLWIAPKVSADVVPPACIHAPGYSSCPLPIAQITPLTSRVENPQLSHIHTATDVTTASPAGCGSCGGASANAGGVTTDIALTRTHRYADQFRAGSFGPGVFGNFDIQLTLWNDGEAGEIWDPSAASPIPLTATGGGAYADQKRSAIKGCHLLKADGTPADSVADAVTAVANLHDGGAWVFELVQAGLGGDHDRHGRLIAIRDRAGNQATITYAFPATASDADLGGLRPRLLEMAAATDQRGRRIAFTYTWSCGQPVVSTVTTPAGAVIRYFYDGDIAGVSRIAYPDGTESTFTLREDPATQTMVVQYRDAGAEGTHRTKDVYLTLDSWQPADVSQPRVPQPCNRVRRVVGATGEVTYLNWLKRDGANVQIYVFEGGGVAGQGRMLRLDTIEGVTQTTWAASNWSFATDPSTWTWAKLGDYEADAQFRMGAQVDPLGGRTAYERDPASGAITGRTRTTADGTVLSRESTVYNSLRLPTRQVDANGVITTSAYDAAGNLLSRTEGITRTQDGSDDLTQAVTWQWTYRPDGQVLTQTDPLGRVTVSEYDERGFKVAEVTPGDKPGDPALRRTWHYDAAGRLDQSADAAGHSVSYAFDSRNRLTTTTYADGSIETVTYGQGADANLVIARTDRNGRRTTFGYDAAGREIARTEGADDPAVAVTTATTYLEGTDLPLTVTRAGQTTRYQYDTRKRQIAITTVFGDGREQSERTVYDAADRVAYTEDAFGRRTYSVYDGLDRVTRTIREAIPGGVSAESDLATLPRLADGNPAYVVEETSYDAGGRVLATTDGRGVSTSFTYDNHGRVLTRTEAAGTAVAATWEYRYDALGNRVAEIDPLQRTKTWTYTQRNLAASETIAAGTAEAATSAFTYTATGQRATVTDALGRTVTSLYGGCCDRLTAVQDALGFTTSYTYLPGGQVESVTDANGHVTTTRFDALNRPIQVTDATGATTTTTYDQNLTDGLGLDAQFVEIWSLADRSSCAATAITSSTGEVTVRVMDTRGRVRMVIDPRRKVTTTSYDSLVDGGDGQVLVAASTIDPVNHNTMVASDGLGRARSMSERTVLRQPAGTVIDTNLWDGVGIEQDYPDQVAALPDRSATTATKTVDGQGRVTVSFVWIAYTGGNWVQVRTEGPYLGTGDGSEHTDTDTNLLDGSGVEAEFDVSGWGDLTHLKVDKYTDPDGWITLTVYEDQPQQQEQIIGPFDPVETWRVLTQVAYDANGNRLSTRDANGVGEDIQYDERNRPTVVSDTAGSVTVTGYDAVGNVTSRRDGLGATTTWTYSLRNLKLSETDRLGALTRFFYNQAGHMVAISDAENEARKATVDQAAYEAGMTRYTYSARNELLTETFPGPTGGTRSYTYDPAGRLHTRTDQRGITTTYAYDAANRLTGRTYSDGTADSFTLDAAGRILTASAGRSGVKVERAYTSGLLVSETLRWLVGQDGAPQATTVNYAHDDVGRVKTVTYSDGRTLERTFTPRGQVEGLTFGGAQVATLARDAGGRRTGTAFANGLTDTRTYRADNRLAGTSVAPTVGGEAQLALGYSYDANKRKTAETDIRKPALSQGFGYDAQDRMTDWRLSDVADPDGSHQTWTVSPVGDWKETSRDGLPEMRAHTQVHEISTINGQALTNDAAGNLTVSEKGQRFVWDAENRLIEATTAPNKDGVHGTVRYLTDALGRRVARTARGSTTLYVYDGAQVVQEITAPHILPPSAAEDDGALANLATVPDGAILMPTYDKDGKRLDVTRINFQPERTEIPAGFIADKGKDYALRSNTLTYGWTAPEGTPSRDPALIRRFHPMPQYDTTSPMGSGWTWQVALANGSYPVIVVMGDATSRHHTNNVVVQGQAQADPDPYDAAETQSYLKGDFDGYAVQATVTDGVLKIEVGAEGLDPVLAYIEVGPEGLQLTDEMKKRLSDEVEAATQRTGGKPYGKGNEIEVKSLVYSGDYIDEPLMVETKSGRFYVHANAQFSPMAISNAAGEVVERRQYGPYGEIEVNEEGVPPVELSVGYTGREWDADVGMYYFRARWYSPKMGRFVNRDPAGYVDGASLYRAYFVPGAMDPRGLALLPVHTFMKIKSAVNELAGRPEVQDVWTHKKEIGWVIGELLGQTRVSQSFISTKGATMQWDSGMVNSVDNPLAIVHVHPSSSGGATPLSPTDVMAAVRLAKEGSASAMVAISLGDCRQVNNNEAWITYVEFDKVTADENEVDALFDLGSQSGLDGLDRIQVGMGNHHKATGSFNQGSYFEGFLQKAQQERYFQKRDDDEAHSRAYYGQVEMLYGIVQYAGLTRGFETIRANGKQGIRYDSWKVRLP